MKTLLENLDNKLKFAKNILEKELIDIFGEEYALIIKENLSKVNSYFWYTFIDKTDIYKLKDIATKNKFLEPEIIDEAASRLLKKIKICDDINKENSIYKKVCEKYFPMYKNIGYPGSLVKGLKEINKPIRAKNNYELRKIQKERIATYNLLGIKLGEDYNDYLNNNEVKELKRNKKLINDFISEIEQLTRMYTAIYSEIKGNFEKINKLLEEKKYKKQLTELENKETSCCYINYINNEVYPVVLISFESFMYGQEDHIIHELIHASMTQKTKCGVECGEGNVYLNEAITEAMTGEIQNRLKEKKQYLLYENPSVRRASKYTPIVPIGKAFIEKFGNDLGKMLYLNKEELYKIIDKDTLYELEKICHFCVQSYVSEELINIQVNKAINMIKKYNIANKNR